jgi:hypothetical protein
MDGKVTQYPNFFETLLKFYGSLKTRVFLRNEKNKP